MRYVFRLGFAIAFWGGMAGVAGFSWVPFAAGFGIMVIGGVLRGFMAEKKLAR